MADLRWWERVEPRDDPGQPRQALQVAILIVTLLGLSVVLFFASAPVGTVGPPAPGPAGAAHVTMTSSGGPSLGSSRPTLHLVLVVDDPRVASALRSRIRVDEFVLAERGAALGAPTIEVVDLSPHGDLSTPASLYPLLAGLAEFEAHCVVTSCPAIQLLDLRGVTAPRVQ